MRYRKKLLRLLALFMAFNMIIMAILPTMTYALTSGPSQPEFSSFEPVATTNMVNDFSGDFTYNLPLLEVPGPQGSSYPVSLSYHSGASTEEEASWVGFGWTLNAGAINRSARGIPDDFKDKPITNYNKMPKNWTATVGGDASVELFGKDILAATAQLAVRYNNYRGFGFNIGVGVGVGAGVFDIGYSTDNGEGAFSLNVNPAAILDSFKELSDKEQELTQGTVSLADDKEVSRKSGIPVFHKNQLYGLSRSAYSLYQYRESVKSLDMQSYNGQSVTVSIGLEKNQSLLPAGSTANIYGTYTWQENQEQMMSDAYGYLYSAEANLDDNNTEESERNNMMDYHTDNGSTFNKRDTVLGTPFQDADQFIVSGEGLSGGFRLHHKSIGHFGPTPARGTVGFAHIAAELSYGGTPGTGFNFGGGFDAGSGTKKSELQDWNKYPSGSQFSAISEAGTTDEPVFFRFNNDMGGSWGESLDDQPFRAAIIPNLTSSGYLPFLTETSSFKYLPNDGERSARSSFIGYNLNKDVLATGNLPSYKAYSKRPDINMLAGKSLAALSDNIGELAIFNESGMRYIYGLPVYSRNEENLSFSVQGGTATNNRTVHFSPENATKYFTEPKVKIGKSQPDAYATSFLLTEITTPDYVDRSLDGPTLDDFGGYTRFNYKKLYGPGSENSDWYRWRFPFDGLLYQRNTLSDSKDDMGTVARGEKEIYYLRNIETKSHVAVFYTSDRTGDALGALPADNTFTDLYDSNDLSPTQKPDDRLKRLDKIELYPISAFQKNTDGQLIRNSDGTLSLSANVTPIKTVHFEYAPDPNTDPQGIEELSKGAPNMTDGRGKLTLVRVYFEYNGRSNTSGGATKISPYQFVYNYPDFNQYPAKYRSGGDEDLTLNVLDENPDYSSFSLDAWGNYQPDGEEQYLKMKTWLDQTKRPNVDFDPAAWQLKVIKLPSGGEIHVQYESDDYQYVQNQEAHIMVSLLPGTSESLFIIDHEKAGLNEADPDFSDQLFQLRKLIKDRYVDGGEKLYFKFLYKLLGDIGLPEINSCNSEFIDGYVEVESVVVNTPQGGGAQIEVQLKGDDLPHDVCEEFTKTQRLGMLNTFGDCSPTGGALSDENGAVETVVQLFTLAQGLIFPATMYRQMDYANSYFRVPSVLPKRGGGLRVKRLLTFDQGLEGTPVLYGNEYHYKTLDDDGRLISSGVATNEPQSIREENVLVNLLPRGNQSLISTLIAGEDKKQQEGQVGESIYPGASVGYSKVTITNIHSGETNPGFTVNEYYTSKDYPIKAFATDIDSQSDIRFLYTGLANFFKRNEWAVQGFSFVLNNMHGQIRRTASYTGDYSDKVTLDKSTIVSEQVFEYFEPGEQIKVKSTAFGSTEMASPGKEVELTLAQKLFRENTTNGNAELDASIGTNGWLPFPIPFFSSVPTMTSTTGIVATHASTKVIKYPAILKKTTTYQDGIYHIAENLVFDKYTGKPVATRSYDEFNGTFISQDIKASWEYKSMKAMAGTEGKLIDAGFTLTNDQLKLTAGEVCDLSVFTRGDLIELGDGTQALFHVLDIDYVTESLIVEVSQQNNAPQVQSASNVRIIRTGRTNVLNASVGSVTRHDPEPDAQTTIAIVDETRYNPAHNLATDLNTQMNQLSATEGTFILAGPYLDMNMSAYQQEVGETIDWTKADVRQVEIRYSQEADRVIVEIMAFEIACSSCSGGWYELAAEGWN